MEGAPHTAKRNLGVPLGCPPPLYIREGGGGGQRPGGARQGGSPTWTPSPSRIRPPTFSFQRRGKEGRRGEEEGKGGRAPSPSYSDSPWGARLPLVGCPLFSPMAHEAHDFPRGVPVTPRYSDKIPESLGTIPMSEYNLPIYESLPLDHFETPRHVRDLIRDSEQPSVIKSHNS